MITPDKISEWLKEVEERPSSGSIIIQYIANRLSDLTARNEELLAENIELRSGRKVEEYESRITNLEYQLDLLKRQFGGQLPANAQPVETSSLLVYTPQGQVLRVELDPAELVSVLKSESEYSEYVLVPRARLESFIKEHERAFVPTSLAMARLLK